jgi:hypothetical protein
MPTEVWVPRLGLVMFSDHMTRDEQERAMYRLCMTPSDERAALVRPFAFEDETGARVEGLEYLDAPLTGVDAGRLMAVAHYRFKSDVALRAKWFKQAGAFLAFPNTPTECHVCLSCGDALPPGDLFGRCPSCTRAAIRVTFETDDVALPHGVN